MQICGLLALWLICFIYLLYLMSLVQEQHILEELHRPHTWAGQKKSHFVTAPPQQPTPFPLYQPVSVLPYLPPPQPALPQPPRIIQQTVRHSVFYLKNTPIPQIWYSASVLSIERFSPPLLDLLLYLWSISHHIWGMYTDTTIQTDFNCKEN